MGDGGGDRGGGPASRRGRVALVRWPVVAAVLLGACTGPRAPAPPSGRSAGPPPSATATAEVTSTMSATPTAAPVPVPSASPTPVSTPVPIRVESLVADVPTVRFRAAVEATLTDPRGWQRAGFAFDLDAPDPPYRLVLAEGTTVDDLCHPLDTGGTYSCQNGPVVALNAARWRTATPSWPGTLEEYRTMLVNHEVGHLLHLHHPRPQCPGEGLPAPVMAQQSTTLEGCRANPWPLRWEVELAARQAEPLAPPADHDTRDHQPSPPPVTE